RRRPTQEGRGHGWADTKAIRDEGVPFRRRLEPFRRDTFWPDAERTVADLCNGRRSHTGNNTRHVTPGDKSSLPALSAGWSSLPLQHSEWAERGAWRLSRLARREPQAAAARRGRGYQVYGRGSRRHDQRRWLAGLRARRRIAGPAL